MALRFSEYLGTVVFFFFLAQKDTTFFIYPVQLKNNSYTTQYNFKVYSTMFYLQNHEVITTI